MIDWNDNAKAAVSAYNDWALENDLAIHTFFEHLTNVGLPQTKTVADAVEALKDRNPCINYGYVAVCKIAHSDWLEVGDFEFVGEGYDKEIFDIVCTRAEFEAYAKGQEGEKWTHVVETTGKKCKLLNEDPDDEGCYAILLSYGVYDVEHGDFLKPIKPTIDESQAWVKMQSLIPKHGVTAAYQMTIQQYDII